MRYTTIIYDVKKELGLSLREYVLLDAIYHLQTKAGWCYSKNEYFANLLEISVREVQKIKSKLVNDNLLLSIGKGKDTGFKTLDKWNDMYLGNHEQKFTVPRTKVHGNHEQKFTDTIYKESDNKIDIADDSKEPSKFSTLGADLIKEMEALDPKNKKYYNNKSQRQAADFLIEEYTFEKAVDLIRLLPRLKNSIPYMPSITTPCELRDKWQKVMDAIQRYKVSGKSKAKENLANVVW